VVSFHRSRLAASLCFVPVFEVLDSRYAAFPDLPLPELLADANGNGAIILGDAAICPCQNLATRSPI
jgi:2-keto-4-pentenoate hydratase